MFTKLIKALKKFWAKIFPPPVVLELPPEEDNRIPWTLTVVSMDGLNRSEVVDTPLREAIDFVEKFSMFKINLNVVETQEPHTYFSYLDDFGREVFNMLRDQIPLSVRNALPVSHSFVFLYKMFGRLPAQGGSTLGVPDGIPSPPTGKIRRPYSCIPADVAQYGSQPFEGFSTQRAQILAHEIINGINCVTSWTPYNCTEMIGITPRAYEYESERLQCLTDDDYDILRQELKL